MVCGVVVARANGIRLYDCCTASEHRVGARFTADRRHFCDTTRDERRTVAPESRQLGESLLFQPYTHAHLYTNKGPPWGKGGGWWLGWTRDAADGNNAVAPANANDATRFAHCTAAPAAASA